MNPILNLISLVLPDNFINVNSEKFRTKALAQSKSQNSEDGENISSNHGKHLVFVNLKLHGKHICPKIRTLAAVVASCYFVHFKKRKRVKRVLLLINHFLLTLLWCVFFMLSLIRIF